MISDLSYGVIPVRRVDSGWDVLLVQHHEGHWSFPKGHQEPGESGEQTARRELFEEVGIHQVQLMSGQRFSEEYSWINNGAKHHKIVTYFLGLVDDNKVVIQSEELKSGGWIPEQRVETTLTFPVTRAAWKKAQQALRQNPLWT